MESSLEEFSNSKAYLKDLPIHWFKILSGDADNPMKSAELD